MLQISKAVSVISGQTKELCAVECYTCASCSQRRSLHITTSSLSIRQEHGQARKIISMPSQRITFFRNCKWNWYEDQRAHCHLEILHDKHPGWCCTSFQDWLKWLRWLEEASEQRFFLSNISNTGTARISRSFNPTTTHVCWEVYPNFTEMLEIAQSDESEVLFGKFPEGVSFSQQTFAQDSQDHTSIIPSACTSLPETTHAQQLRDAVASRVTKFSVSQA